MTADLIAEFNLRALIREVLTESSSADPGQITHEVLQRIKPPQRVLALHQALRSMVRETITQQRMTSAPDETNASRPVSWKQAAIRKAWQEQLQERLYLGDDSWKMLRDCTRDELLFVAAERRKLAAQNIAKAEKYEALAARLEARGVTSVAELSEDDLEPVFGAAA